MYTKLLQQAGHERRYQVRNGQVGWEVVTEQDRQVTSQVCYRDWHRVERAMAAMSLEVSMLRERGWQEIANA